MDTPKLTPLMAQYAEIKAKHPDKILIYRMGDFYEMFYDDAVKASAVLNIALTSRNKNAGNDTPMCGVPHHSIAGPINKLLKAGFKVAICDQVEDPATAKGIVKREVTRVVSPGVVYDSDQLEADQTVYVAAVLKKQDVNLFDLALVDTSTGESLYADDLEKSDVFEIIKSFRPRELLLEKNEKNILLDDSILVTRVDNSSEFRKSGAKAFLVDFVAGLQGQALFKTLKPFQEIERKVLKYTSVVEKHLEIFETFGRDEKGSLFWATDRTLTPMGRRKFKRLLRYPLVDLKAINQRHDQVEWFLKNETLRSDVRSRLRNLGDLERKISKLSNPICNARDLAAIRESFRKCEELRGILGNLVDVSKELQKLSKWIVEEPPHSTKEAGIFNEGVSQELDELIKLTTHASDALLELEAKERTQSGISSLKVKYNHVFGYSFEITKSNLDRIPKHFVRRQTLANAERFVTDELVGLEEKILSAQTKRAELEFQYFEKIKSELLDQSLKLYELVDQVARLDFFTALAELAFERSYVRPQILESDSLLKLTIKNSRHAVIEQLDLEKFTPNDIEIKSGDCLLITGPNMAGKSTLMRQAALTVILAQMGGFVPSTQCQISICDQILTRIGASDNLSQGLSTFMVEMTETAQILNSVGPRSLVLLDEIGRGTSTFDGLSLAQAILEHFLTRSKAFVFFATHYHELTELDQKHANLQNFHMAIKEHGGDLVFLRKLVVGPASKSYGIQVAKKAGLPTEILSRAKEVLKELELHTAGASQAQYDLFSALAQPKPDPSIAEPTDGQEPILDEQMKKASELMGELKELNLTGLTPIDALNKLDQWQRSLN